jgi:hypothetical protein
MKEEKGKEPEKDARGNVKPPKYREFMTQYTNDFARATQLKWNDLKVQLWSMYAMGW